MDQRPSASQKRRPILLGLYVGASVVLGGTALFAPEPTKWIALKTLLGVNIVLWGYYALLFLRDEVRIGPKTE